MTVWPRRYMDALAGSMQSMPLNSSLPKSLMLAAFSCQGFHTTVSWKPLLLMTTFRLWPGSTTATWEPARHGCFRSQGTREVDVDVAWRKCALAVVGSTRRPASAAPQACRCTPGAAHSSCWPRAPARAQSAGPLPHVLACNGSPVRTCVRIYPVCEAFDGWTTEAALFVLACISIVIVCYAV